MRYVTRPLSPEARRRLTGRTRDGSPFSAPWISTLDLLDREMNALGVSEFVMQIDCAESDLRLDGMLRANASPASPAVAIALDSPSKGSLLFVCGRFWGWQDNVRAIALGLEALRRIERYGIVRSDEQYRGWQALPPGQPMPPAPMTLDEAMELLLDSAGDDDGLCRSWRELYRRAAMRHHPDSGGDPAMFDKITRARDVLADREKVA